MNKLMEYLKRFSENSLRLFPASEEKIRRLVELSPSVLPSSYVQFLSLMGEGFEGVNLETSATTAIDRVISYLEDEREVDFIHLESGLVPFLISRLGEDPYCLDSVGTESVFSGSLRSSGRCAESLENYLCQRIFQNLESRSYSEVMGAFSREPSPIFPEIRQALLDAGFLPEPFSDGWRFCGRTDGGIVVLHQSEFKSPVLFLAHQGSEKERNAFSEISDEFGLNVKTLP